MESISRLAEPAEAWRSYDLTPNEDDLYRLLAGNGYKVLSSIRAWPTHIEDQVFKVPAQLNILPRRGMDPSRFDDQGWSKGASGFDFEDIGDPALWKGNEHTKSEVTSAYIVFVGCVVA
jgi:hypothetical protein